MSKRRKNAGEGYGFMFSGAFSEKKDAVKKEKQRKGSFIKGMPTRNGYRYVVMTPRTNPIKRKKKEKPPVESYEPRPAQNPSELLVMGANPHEPMQEIVLQPGARLVIRNNPADARQNSLASFHPGLLTPKQQRARYGRTPYNRRVAAMVRRARGASQLTSAELKKMEKTARAGGRPKRKLEGLFHEVYGRDNPAAICGAMVGGYQCTRKPGHRGPHLPQGATMRTRTRLPHNWQPRGNPSAEALRESFTGKPVGKVKIFDEPHMPAGDYAMVGKVLTLYVKPLKGGQVLTITPTGVIAVADESARQIYFVGGDQDVSSGLGVFGAIERKPGVWELGEARRIDYRQRKEHVEFPDQDAWRHEFGEESGVRPTMLFDANFKRLLLEGGEYVIREEGIVN